MSGEVYESTDEGGEILSFVPAKVTTPPSVTITYDSGDDVLRVDVTVASAGTFDTDEMFTKARRALAAALDATPNQ